MKRLVLFLLTAFLRAKGEKVTNALVAGILNEIEELRRSNLPERTAKPQ